MKIKDAELRLLVETLQTGDYIFYKPTTVKGKLVVIGQILKCILKGGTLSPYIWYSHGSIIVENWDIPYVNEATPWKGVTSTPAFIQLKDQDFIVMRFTSQLYEDQLAIPDRDIARRANKKLGHTEYDRHSVVWKHIYKFFTGRWIKDKHEDKAMNCGEYQAWVWHSKYGNYWDKTPMDVMSHDDLVKVYST